jgi:glyoxylase-like metal-dependent hydrolase (beta-lactamase superfamily II)
MRVAVLPVTPFSQNCTLIWDETTRHAVVVDPGGDVPRILSALGKTGADVQDIWLTHGHLDHAGGAVDLKNALNRREGHKPVSIIGPDRRDEPLLQALPAQGNMFGIHGLPVVEPDRFLAEGEQLTLADQVFDILHCPGHTPGHVVFVNRAARFAQLGDVLFAGSVGRTDFPYGDHAALIDAIKSKLLPLGDDLAFVCGHGPNSTIGAERRNNPFLQ